jgi:DNA-binding response OmpR family regulator
LLREPDAPKLVIFDWMMPGRDGIELCREVRSRKNEPYTYILLLTSKRTKAEVVEGLDAGADDYITKPFDPQEL